MGAELTTGRPRLPAHEIELIRRQRQRPTLTQFDGLHLQKLRVDLAEAISAVDPPPRDVLDIFCGTRPYEELLPPGARCIGLDIDDHYGTADVISTEFLPFEDESFDLVMCTSGFYYVEDSAQGVAEIERVLRPGGTALLTVPLIWEYDRDLLEHRFTGPELARLFAGWDDVKVMENGGRAVSWAMLSGRLFEMVEQAVPDAPRRLVHPLFAAIYLGINLIAMVADWGESRFVRSSMVLPMNLTLTARKPAG